MLRGPHTNSAGIRAGDRSRLAARSDPGTAGKRACRGGQRKASAEDAAHDLRDGRGWNHAGGDPRDLEEQPNLIPLPVGSVRHERKRLLRDLECDGEDLHPDFRRRRPHASRISDGAQRQRVDVRVIRGDGRVPPGGCPPGTGAIPIATLTPPARLDISSATVSPRVNPSTGAIHLHFTISGSGDGRGGRIRFCDRGPVQPVHDGTGHDNRERHHRAQREQRAAFPVSRQSGRWRSSSGPETGRAGDRRSVVEPRRRVPLLPPPLAARAAPCTRGAALGGFGGRPLVVGVRWSFADEDAGSVNSSAIHATEDALSGRAACAGD